MNAFERHLEPGNATCMKFFFLSNADKIAVESGTMYSRMFSTSGDAWNNRGLDPILSIAERPHNFLNAAAF